MKRWLGAALAASAVYLVGFVLISLIAGGSTSGATVAVLAPLVLAGYVWGGCGVARAETSMAHHCAVKG